MNQNTTISVVSAILGIGMLLALPQANIAQPAPSIANSLQSQPAAYRTVTQQTARQTLSTVEIAPGRVSAIDFSSTNEVITYVLLGDSSRVVYTVNAKLGSAQAKTLFLRQIEQLRFPGATTAPITTLSVQTTDSAGQLHLYTFNLVLSVKTRSNQTQYAGLMVVPNVPNTPTTPSHQLVVNHNRTATLNDVEEGLTIAIRRGYTSLQDPVVESVKQFLALARNGSTVKEAANQAKVSLPVVSALAEMALDERLLRLLQPVTDATKPKVAEPAQPAQPAETAEPSETITSAGQPVVSNVDLKSTEPMLRDTKNMGQALSQNDNDTTRHGQ